MYDMNQEVSIKDKIKEKTAKASRHIRKAETFKNRNIRAIHPVMSEKLSSPSDPIALESPNHGLNLTTVKSSELDHLVQGLSSVSLSASSSVSSPSTAFESTDSNKSNLSPTHHLPNGNGFRNPWPSATSNLSNLTQIINNGIPIQIAKKLMTEIKPIRTLPADLKLYSPNVPHAQSSPLDNRSSTKLVSTWLGHAGYLVQLPALPNESQSSSSSWPIAKDTSSTNTTGGIRPFRALFDPMFSSRAGPTQWTGPKRLQPSPCHVKQIPRVDVCLISHSHYDHLDFDTIKELAMRQPHIKYFVPLGLKAWFDSVSVASEQIVELDWWQSSDFDLTVRHSQRTPGGNNDISINDQSDSFIRITCVPAQHSSGRSLFDQNSTLWCGWIIEKISTQSIEKLELRGVEPDLPTGEEEKSLSAKDFAPLNTLSNKSLRGLDIPTRDFHPGKKTRCCVYFAGDTGYRSQHDRDLICPVFKEIGEKFGPIDFSMIPIWRGGTLSFISWAGFRIADPSFLVAHHATPEDAIRIHLDVKSKHSIGIHHSCFIGHEQESLEALMELKRYKAVYNVGDFETLNGFGTVDVGETIELDMFPDPNPHQESPVRP